MLLAVDLVVVGLLIGVAVALEARRRLSNVVARAMLLSGVIVLLFLSPVTTDWLILRLNPTEGIGRIYVDPSGIVLFAPAAAVLFLVTISRTLFKEHSSSPKSTRWSVGFYSFTVAVILANSMNMCSPSWCGRFGFPFPYYSWSDAIIVFNGESSSPWSPTAAILDVIVYVIGSAAIGVVYRREVAPLSSRSQGSSSA